MPVLRTTTRGRRAHATSATPAAASAPTCAAPSTVPAGSSGAPARTSPPTGRTWAPVDTASGISILSPDVTTFSIGTTASAPSGTAPPVEISIASPDAAAARPARRPRSGRRPAGGAGVSTARTANPSIAELANGGRSTSAATSAASTRPAASATGTRSGSSGTARARTRASASSIDSNEGIWTHTLTAVISVIVPVHDEERSVALLHDELASVLEPLAQPWEVVFVDDGSTDGTFAALTRLHAAHERSARRPPAAQLRQVGGAAGRLRGSAGGHRRHDRRRPPGRSGGDPAPAREARRGLRPRLGLEDQAARPALAARCSRGSSTPSRAALRAAPARPQLRAEGVPRRGRARPSHLRRAAPLHPRARALPRLSRRRAAGEPPAARARALALRDGALRARLPRSAHRHLHGPLPAPAAAPLRRRRTPPRCNRDAAARAI